MQDKKSSISPGVAMCCYASQGKPQDPSETQQIFLKHRVIHLSYLPPWILVSLEGGNACERVWKASEYTVCQSCTGLSVLFLFLGYDFAEL